MSNELKESLIIGIELILFGFIILIIAMFGDYARDAFILKEAQNQSMHDIQEYRTMYNLTEGAELDLGDCDDAFLESMGEAPSGKNEPKIPINVSCEDVFDNSSYGFMKAIYLSDIVPLNIVTGDDIVRFAALHPKEYNMFIRIDDDTDNDILLKNAVGINEAVTEEEQAELRGIWDISTLSETLGKNVNSYFLCVAAYNSNFYSYSGVIFVKIPVEELPVYGIELEEEEELSAF